MNLQEEFQSLVDYLVDLDLSGRLPACDTSGPDYSCSFCNALQAAQTALLRGSAP